MKTWATIVVLVAGCYNPQVEDGGLKCAVGDRCPMGMGCYSGLCWYHQPLASSDAGVTETGAARDAVAEAVPVVRFLDQPCDPVNAGTDGRTDNCSAGLVCVDGNVGSTCMKRCAANSECGDAMCEQRRVDTTLATTAQVCDPATATCDPVAPTAGCVTGVCYLSNARTVCETSSGDVAGGSCLYSRECIPGYTCATSGPRAGRCVPVCRGIAGACPAGLTCSAAADELGYCF